MLERGCTHVAMAEYFGVSHDTIARRIKREGLNITYLTETNRNYADEVFEKNKRINCQSDNIHEKA